MKGFNRIRHATLAQIARGIAARPRARLIGRLMKNENAQLAGALIGLGGTITQAMNELEGFVPCGHPASVVIDGLVSLDANLTEGELAEKTETTCGFIEHVSEHRGVPAHAVADATSLSTTRRELLDNLESVAKKLQPKGGLHQNINEWLYRSLAALEGDNEAVALQLAEANVMNAAVEQI